MSERFPNWSKVKVDRERQGVYQVSSGQGEKAESQVLKAKGVFLSEL